MTALLLALVALTGNVQDCGNGPGTVTWWGAESADLAPVGYGDCTNTAWIDPLGVEIELEKGSDT